MLADLINQLFQEFKKELVEELKREFFNTIKHSEEDKLFTPEELAQYLHVSKEWIYKDGKKLIPYVKPGANLRFRKKMLSSG
jgi:transposase